ncbi:histidine kinase [Xanthomonadaceae bacterium JHOS43]|nr:histidine kinase [Xanthomonadaceae bacterium JHOS43]MCX7564521.1 histidine kinase [Xanthomonadaceae bacterium XH05]
MSSTSSWMPDFCRPQAVFGVMVAVEVAVLTAILLRLPQAPGSWTELFTASLLAQWLALLCVAALCKLREPIDRLPRLSGVILALATPTVIVGIGTFFVVLLDQALALGFTVTPAYTLRFIAVCMGVALLLAAALLRYFYVSGQWRGQVAAHAHAQVQALQARIRPHFLFNSMNSIASLIRHDPATAERAVEDLSELFRAALGAGDGESTLADELHLCERYLAIEALRLGSRLRVRWELSDDLPRDLPLPRLILQPLVENAIVHGIARLSEGGELAISARREGFQLHIDVRNPMPSTGAPSHGNHHAQSSISQRLTHRFGPRARMAASARDGYYAATLIVPIDTE